MKIIQKFISIEAAGGLVLFLAAMIALIWSNSPFHSSYEWLTTWQVNLNINHFLQTISLPFIINDMLMTLFFVLIGLEIKRELVEGELDSFKKAILPAFGALGGMLIPAGIYLTFNWHDAHAMRGWAIPTATDIAFSLAVLSLLGKRVPLGLKIFLTALAIFDDLGAIIIIAFFYTKKIYWSGFALACVLELMLIAFNIFEIVRPFLYFLFGILIWWLFLVSGIHPTLAGVLVALTIPLTTSKKSMKPAIQFEQSLHPWVTFFILPVFALMNAGISFYGLFENLITPISLGIALGLLVGKPLGVLSFCWLSLKFKIAQLPEKISLRDLLGVSFLCGIGFTMSFFIGFLSFPNGDVNHQLYMRSGILLGSLLSGLIGYCYLYVLTRDRSHSALS